MRKYYKSILFICTILLFIMIPRCQENSSDLYNPNLQIDDTITCNILLNNTLKAKGDAIGYLYELMGIFDKQHKTTFKLTPKMLDSIEWKKLYLDSIDMLIINISDTVPDLYQEAFLSSLPLTNDSIICVTVKNKYNLIQTFNHWFNSFKHTKEYFSFISKYPSLHNEVYSKTRVISPYDNLIKQHSKNIGWDWRLVASLIYQESKFKAGVSSSRGAIGLMQIKESTGKLFGVENIYDPEENIKAGTLYLRKLQNQYSRKGADSLNSVLLALAAYNCGEGRIADCMIVAKNNGENHLTWEGLKNIIPQMKNKEIYSHPDIKLGKFKGNETIKFVDNIMTRYDIYKKKIFL